MEKNNIKEIDQNEKPQMSQPTPEQLITAIHSGIDQVVMDLKSESYISGIQDACTSISDTIIEMKNKGESADAILNAIVEMLDSGK